ncbi:hypothetical protein LH128_24197 [Sphingomonas sp. LH128]|uniref:DUF1552 domain-containing protein n=1 Tax=Novosphingobium resinovorum TaxID=158500 RepID=A0A031K5A1_9SPHN|nr:MULTISPECIES: DUF1552 domain-containing protein [Sphingomonadaceae]EJU10322.1 hypothetical protein LH128_24197 [Sphingomonas sp. LH128]EZP84379.1 hypothetical protein BV97_00130 [Novosphingobium resinovorum]
MRVIRPALSRRTLLRGAGAAMALPFLEAMMPSARAADLSSRPKRLQVFYSPNGMTMPDFLPTATGADYVLPSSLQPLAPHREQIAVISGLGHPQAAAMGDRPAGHGRSCPAFLTGAHAKQTEGPDIRAGVSMDQVFAQHLGDATPLASLELGIDTASLLGSCDINYSCAYTNGISWLTPTVPLPVEANPRAVFERLFGDGDTDEAGRLAQLRRQSSILDFVMDDTRRLSGQLGMEDKRKLDEYLDATRAIEKRIQRSAASPATTQAANLQQPAGIPDDFAEHVRLMIDLQVLAMQADITRVGTFMIGRELSNRTYPEIGVPDSHHMLSHHGNNPDKMAQLAKINRYHMEFFAYYLQKMKDTRDGEASLLDRTLVIRGSAFGDSNEHDYMDLPVIVAGGLVKGGRHSRVEKGTTMSNLMLAGLQTLGVPTAKFGDSTGPLRELADA